MISLAYFLPGLALAALSIKYSGHHPLWAKLLIAATWLVSWPVLFGIFVWMVISDLNDSLQD